MFPLGLCFIMVSSLTKNRVAAAAGTLRAGASSVLTAPCCWFSCAQCIRRQCLPVAQVWSHRGLGGARLTKF